MKSNAFGNLLAFLQRLRDAKIDYTIRHSRDDALMVVVYTPGEYWEIDFVANGDVDIERFRSDGQIQNEAMLEELFALWSDNSHTSEVTADADGTVAHS